jgi:hypothetical protein
MPLLGRAAVAMWWDVDAAQRAEFAHWHSHEHFPERMQIPGFLRGSRWRSTAGDDGYFVLYELATYEILTSPHYVARLNDPTPWSTKMMPHHRNMVRSQCRVAASFGGGVAANMLTIRLRPAPGRSEALHGHLDELLFHLAPRAGFTGAHLLQTETPAAAMTKEQRIRGGDAVADWIVLVSGYDAQALHDLTRNECEPDVLLSAGAGGELKTTLGRLSYTMTPSDL